MTVILHSYCTSFTSMICSAEWTPLANALVVVCGMHTNDLRILHPDTEVFRHEVNGGMNLQVRIPLAAARAADLSDGTQGPRRHLV